MAGIKTASQILDQARTLLRHRNSQITYCDGYSNVTYDASSLPLLPFLNRAIDVAQQETLFARCRFTFQIPASALLPAITAYNAANPTTPVYPEIDLGATTGAVLLTIHEVVCNGVRLQQTTVPRQDDLAAGWQNYANYPPGPSPTSGQPRYYYTDGAANSVGLVPAPDQQYYVTILADSAVSDLSLATDALPTQIPAIYHSAFPFKVALYAMESDNENPNVRDTPTHDRWEGEWQEMLGNLKAFVEHRTYGDVDDPRVDDRWRRRFGRQGST